MNRRDLLKGAAAAPLAMLPISSVMAADRSDWNKALTAYRTAVANEERITAHCNALYEGADAACPRREEFFSRYKLGVTHDHGRNVRSAYMALLIERSKGRHFTEEEVQQTLADAEAVVADFEQWVRDYDHAFSAYEAFEPTQEAAIEAVTAARVALLKAEAPDNAALLFKIEVLADFLAETESEDTEPMTDIRADARRLLSHARA